MREIIEGIVVIVFILLIFIYHIFESRAIQKAHQRPLLMGREALVGKVARVVELTSEREREKHLRVFLDGTYWNAVSRDDNRSLIKVDDKVQVTNIEDLKLIVVLA
jgi:membrane protein implicated in regulation of membrane protease activity